VTFAAVVWCAWRVATPWLQSRLSPLEITVLCQLALIGLAGSGALVLRRVRPSSLSFRLPGLGTALACLALGGTSWALGFVVERAVQVLMPGSESWLGYGSIAWTRPDLATVLVATGLAPVAEELFFRGILYGGARRDGSRLLAALVSAASFAAFHPPFSSALRSFARGLVFAAAVEETQTIVSAILIHAASNSVALAWEHTPMGRYLQPRPVALLFLTMGVAIALRVKVRRSRSRVPTPREQDMLSPGP
jgi:membrane protease YdiL (CAAX protease family)